ncbi:hypothetical protein ACRRTK_018299 [Alexandromys fortis]
MAKKSCNLRLSECQTSQAWILSTWYPEFLVFLSATGISHCHWIVSKFKDD